MHIGMTLPRANNQLLILGIYKQCIKALKLPLGNQPEKSAPLKSKTGDIIIDKDKQLDRWVEHYLELYSLENSITQEALDSVGNLST